MAVIGEYIPAPDPCPFCGKTPHIITYQCADDSAYNAEIHCNSCNVQMVYYGSAPPKDYKAPSGWWDTSKNALEAFKIQLQEAAIKKWNTRREAQFVVRWQTWNDYDEERWQTHYYKTEYNARKAWETVLEKQNVLANAEFKSPDDVIIDSFGWV
jgi:hypothetical protein